MKINTNAIAGLLKTIVVLILGSVITFAGITACIYWLNTPLSIVNILAFVIGYFIVLKPTVKYWAGFLVFIAEYRTIKAQMEERKAVMEKFKKDMEALQSSNETDRDLATEYKQKLEDIIKKMKEKQANSQNQE